MGNIIKSSTSKAESHINIPEEIIVEILSRLPLGSLPRLTCVTKQWSSLISNIIAAKTGSTRVLLISDSRAYSFSPHSIDQNQQHEVDVNSIHVPWKLSESGNQEFKILGSRNGLVLMHIDDDLFLWNPLTRFFKKFLASDRVCDRWENHRVCSGLCYDSTSDEYKAVLVNSCLTPGYCDESVAVGSFRSKSWKTFLFPYYVPLWDSWNIIVNGNLHWFASKNDSEGYFLSPHQIIYFDAHMDKFEEVPMPEPRGEDGDIICGLGVLDGNLCMSRMGRPENSESNVEVLVMKEYAVAKSWTILLVVSDLDGLNFNFHNEWAPLSYTKNGEVLTRVSTWKYVKYDSHIRAFNPIDNSHSKISIPDDPRFYIITYEESLITPTDYGWEEEDLKGEATYVVHSYTGVSWNMKKGSDGHYWLTTCINSAIEAESGEKQRNNMDGLPLDATLDMLDGWCLALVLIGCSLLVLGVSHALALDMLAFWSLISSVAASGGCCFYFYFGLDGSRVGCDGPWPWSQLSWDYDLWL